MPLGLSRGLGREHEDLRARRHPADPPGGLDPIDVRHVEVHQDDVGLKRSGKRDRFSAARATTDDLDALVDRQGEHERLGEERVIIDDQHTHGVRASRQ